MSSKKIACSTLWQIASQITMAALSVLSVKFVAIGLSRDLAGAYNSAYGYLQLFAILADFGLYAVSVQEVSRAPEQSSISGEPTRSQVLGALIVLRSTIALLSLGAALAIAWIVPVWAAGPLRIGITIAAFVPFFTLLAGVLRTVFQVQYKMHLVFIAEVTQRILTTALLAVIIFLGVRLSDDVRVYEYFLAVGAGGAMVLFLLSYFFAASLTRIRPCFDRVLLLSLLRKAMPYGLAFLCIAFYRQFDLTMIALLREDFPSQNAAYGFASRIAEMTYLVPTFLLNSTLPVLADRHDKGLSTSSMLGKTLFSILLFGTVSALFSILWATPIMRLLTTPAYLATPQIPGADTALALLGIPMFLNGIVLYSFYALLTKHAWKVLVSRMMVAVVLSLGLNLWRIPISGFVGAIETSIVTHLFLVATLLPAALRALPVRFHSSYVWRWLLSSVVVAILLRASAPLLTSIFSTALGLLIASLLLILLAMLFGFHRMFSLEAAEDAGR